MRTASALPLALWFSLSALGAEETYNPQAERERSQQRYEWIKRELTSDRPSSAHQRLWREYETTVNLLAYLVDKTDSDDHRRIAVRLLGEMRSKQAVGTLIRHITLGHSWTADRHPLVEYPAARALAEIGEPAMHAILTRRLRQAATAEELKLFARVIYYHHRRMPEVGRFRITHLLEQTERTLEDPSLREGDRNFTERWRENLTRTLEFYNTADEADVNIY